eukprot:TRINITY_DN3476_c0_g1_i1.p2 TRINITY_DN3476_c0_g1~~TRINITY_DN3476_c0_g1_i1.p2  ORF type:complete len:406 (-),score=83.09 TRINITY_DN3476_c0_g1_i1:201-1325(-)
MLAKRPSTDTLDSSSPAKRRRISPEPVALAKPLSDTNSLQSPRRKRRAATQASAPHSDASTAAAAAAATALAGSFITSAPKRGRPKKQPTEAENTTPDPASVQSPSVASMFLTPILSLLSFVMPDSASTDSSVESESRTVEAADKAEETKSAEPSRQEPEEFDPYVFISYLPPLETLARPQVPPLPAKTRKDRKITLVLDLDETLVHCSTTPLQPHDLRFPVMFHGNEYQVYVRKRPYCEEFLRQVAQWFEVVVFTASQRVYADRLLDILDPEGNCISHRAFRDSCVQLDGNFLKDLTVLGRDLAHTVIIDNSPQAFGFQLDNGIPIESWYGNQEDRELLNLLPTLQRIAALSDVRPFLRDTLSLHQRVRAPSC